MRTPTVVVYRGGMDTDTIAVIAADGTGIDIVDALDNTDGVRLMGRSRHTDDAEQLLNDHSWRVVSGWRPTAHEGGHREANVERIV